MMIRDEKKFEMKWKISPGKSGRGVGGGGEIFSSVIRDWRQKNSTGYNSKHGKRYAARNY